MSKQNDNVLVVTPSEHIFQSVQSHLRLLNCDGVWLKEAEIKEHLHQTPWSALIIDPDSGKPSAFIQALRASDASLKYLPSLLVIENGDFKDLSIEDVSGVDDILSFPLREVEFNLRLGSHLKRLHFIADLVAANRLLESAQEKKRKLAALVVHDLRNPLAAISGNVQLLAEEPLDEFSKEIVQDLDTLTQKSMSMVASLLDVEELEDGLLKANKSKVALAEFFGRYPRLYRTLIRARGLDLQFELNGIEDCLFDKELLFRVVENLLDNSMRYAQKNGAVKVTAFFDEGDFCIHVGNDGPPIPGSEHQRIFDRYYRLEARREGARANRGLGLYFCHLACKAHGGSIEVSSNAEFPSGFLIRLPQEPLANLN